MIVALMFAGAAIFILSFLSGYLLGYEMGLASKPKEAYAPIYAPLGQAQGYSPVTFNQPSDAADTFSKINDLDDLKNHLEPHE